jgi:type II restriction enzyme
MNYSRIRGNYNGCNSKEEINEALQKVDTELGQTLFVSNSSVIWKNINHE